ncbi:hypothetical protein V1507DRAFT_32914 [Lipomyces tetrasporus]
MCVRPTFRSAVASRPIYFRVFHYGGLHSDCGISGVVWCAIYWAIALNKRVLLGGTNIPHVTSILAISSTCLTIFVFILVEAYPKLRVLHHNYFELIHRFLGWAAVACSGRCCSFLQVRQR